MTSFNCRLLRGYDTKLQSCSSKRHCDRVLYLWYSSLCLTTVGLLFNTCVVTPAYHLAQEFVEATKENSGLDLGNLNEQPGNRSKQALGEIQTPKGDVSGGCNIFLGYLYCDMNG